MRIIKFRVWDKYNKKMFQHKDILGLNFYLKTTDGKNDIACPLYQFLLKYQEGENQQYNYQIQQATGLRDKNGNEIYECDVVKDLDGEKLVIEFENGSFIAKGKVTIPFWSMLVKNELVQPATVNSQTFEIIGNIFENSEVV